MKIENVKRIGMGILSVILLSSLSRAAESSLAMPSTQEGGTARAMSMGSAVVGLPQGSASLFWNPAALATLNDMELGLHHNSGLGESTQETVVFGLPMVLLGGFAASLNYVDNGIFEGRDSIGNPTGNYTAGSLGINLGWGKQWLPRFSAGAVVKYNQQTLGSQTYSAFAVDLGLLWNPFNHLNLGLTYSNLGTVVAGSLLDSVWRVGASYDVDKNLLVAVSTDLKLGGFNRLQMGAEYYIIPDVAVRAGYIHNFTEYKLDGLTGLTAGLGVGIVKNMVFDYAFVPYGDLGNSHRLSITYKFADAVKTEPVQSTTKEK